MKNRLPGRERIKSRKDFEILYSEGTAFFSQDRKIKCIITSNPSDSGELKMAAVVPGKSGTAVWRNRIKRLIRDSFRLNKYILLDYCLANSKSLRLIISPWSLNQKKNESLNRTDIEKSIIDILKQAKKKF